MDELRDILLYHRGAYPAMEKRDEAKLIYQNEFGGGHLISDPGAALDRLRRELAECRDTGAALFDPVGSGSVRVNLYPASGRVATETLWKIFCLSSRRVRGSAEGFREKLRLLYEFHEKEEVDAFLRDYEAEGFPTLSHSEAYRTAYAPAYRVIGQEYARFFDVISAVDRFSRFAGPVFIGIDGMSASGKTTLGGLLAEIFDANLFHTDDYFLPPEMRTKARLAHPGGNMHRERLIREVFEPIMEGRPAVTRRFDCGTMAYGEPVERPARRVNIVEGSYSLHPELRDYYTLRVALRTGRDTQIRRLQERCPQHLDDFLTRWIPLEDRYHAATDLFSDADMVVET